MDRINVGLIGTGYMGKCHALAWNSVGPVFSDVPKVGLAVLADANAELAAKRAHALGFERSTGDWRDLVADPGVDVISITTPNQFHAEMAIAALEAGKHVWCEKPMAPRLEEARRMLDAASASGKVALLGYNYIQNPIFRHIAHLLREGAIGEVNHVRIEMDEDFMADPEALFTWKSAAASGYGALDDFAVHPLSLIWTLFGRVEQVMCDMAKPYADRPTKAGGRRAVETYDMASILLRLASGASGVLAVNRSAWGRKGRIALQIFGSKGSILFDQERMNEFQLYTTADRTTEQGYRTVLAAPHHAPYDRFIPAPGHGLGFNDLKIIECRQLIGRMRGEGGTHGIGFEGGFQIERTIHAMAQSFEKGAWVEVG